MGGDPPYVPVDVDPGCEVDDRVSDPPYYFSKRFLTKLTCSKPSPDYDRNGRVDLRDYAAFQNCQTEMMSPGDPIPACGAGCAGFDMDPTDTIDLVDFAKDAFILTGP